MAAWILGVLIKTPEEPKLDLLQLLAGVATCRCTSQSVLGASICCYTKCLTPAHGQGMQLWDWLERPSI